MEEGVGEKEELTATRKKMRTEEVGPNEAEDVWRGQEAAKDAL